MERPPRQPALLAQTYVYVLVALIGGVGCIGMWFGTELWHLLVSAPLVLVAAMLLRVVKHGG